MSDKKSYMTRGFNTGLGLWLAGLVLAWAIAALAVILVLFASGLITIVFGLIRLV